MLARSGATVGKSFLFNSEEESCFAGYLIRARANVKIVNPNYLYLYTKSQVFNAWKEITFSRATIQNIGADKYAILPVILPMIKEQKNILNSISQKLALFDECQDSVLKVIEKLKEFKQILIAHAVTGKIKV